ncbi:MAG: ATP-binding protein [Ignavibacteriales bacterium]|nr:ATP-binding protein [Ignavibacteriales bacterium]
MSTLKLPKKLSLNVPSKTEHLSEVRDFVSDAARRFGFADEEVSNIALAVDEACTNIIKHAYHFASDKDITNKGQHFEPDKVAMPDMKEYLSKYKRGGLGMLLMRKLMDKVEYRIQPSRNVVRMVKYLSA